MVFRCFRPVHLCAPSFIIWKKKSPVHSSTEVEFGIHGTHHCTNPANSGASASMPYGKFATPGAGARDLRQLRSHLGLHSEMSSNRCYYPAKNELLSHSFAQLAGGFLQILICCKLCSGAHRQTLSVSTHTTQLLMMYFTPENPNRPSKAMHHAKIGTEQRWWIQKELWKSKGSKG